MDRPTFFDRRPLGIPNYLAIALVAVMLVAVIPRGARKALETNTNKVEDWLPASYSESLDLAWFRQQFGNEAFIVASWEGCTLANAERLRLLADKLTAEPLTSAIASAARVTPHADRRLFTRVVTGPGMIDELTEGPARLDREQAIARLEGAFVGPPLTEGDDLSRTTCLMAYLSPQATINNRSMRLAIERLEEIAKTECGVTADAIHLGGPPVDNVAIDIEGEKTLRSLAGLSGLVGLLLAYTCFRNIRLTGMVLVVAILAAGASLAMVFYYGAFEVLVMGAATPRLGKLDAILMSMPAVVYVLGLSGAIHLVNYYRDAVQAGGRRGAAERAVRMALVPCAVASLTTAIGLASLASSDILPIEKFGVFSAIGVMLALGLLFGLLPVALHRFAPPTEAPAAGDAPGRMPGWAHGMAEVICRHHGWVAAGGGAVMVLFALGLPRIESSVKLIKLLHPEADLVQDYQWLEAQLGNLVPMEVVVAVPAAMQRGVNEHPEAGGTHYRMTTYERMMLSRRVSRQLEVLAPVSRALNASTFAPSEFDSRSPSNRRTHEYIVSQAIDKNRAQLAEFLVYERTDPPSIATGARELWRSSARIAALDDIDYGQFVAELKEAVAPVLAAYQARSELVANLAAAGKQLAGAQVLFIVPSDFTAADALFAELLREAGVNTVVDGRRGKMSTIRVEDLANLTAEDRARLATRDAIVTLSPAVAEQLAQGKVDPVVLLGEASEGGAQLTAVFTGVVPLVYKTQRELLVSLQQSLAMATVLIAGVLVVLLRSLGGGLASMIPNLFPIIVVFGALGWLGISVDIGIMMTASVALGVAVDDTIHFVSWFRRGLSMGLSRHEAAIEAYERCATAMVQTTLIAGLGLAVFAFSTFTPTQQFGYLMVTILTAALIGDLVLLPAMLVGPIGRLFPAARRSPSDLSDRAATADDPMSAQTTSIPSPQPVAAPAQEVDSPGPKIMARVDTTSDAPIPPTPSSESPQRTFEQSHETLSPANAALRAKLRSFRRDAAQDETLR